MRFTIKDLKISVNGLNLALLHDLKCEFINVQGRNGYQATDRHKIELNGRDSCEQMIGGGTSREVNQYSREAYYQIKEKGEKITTRQQAKKLMILNGFDLDGDFHQVSTHELCDLLCKLAKATKYRKPRNANGSTARYFYQHLAKKIKL